MDSKRRNRRGFLRDGAVLAGGLAAGAVRPASAQTPASGAAPAAPAKKDIKELIA